MAHELEWEAADIDRLTVNIPARSKVDAVRALLNERGRQLSGVENGTAALEEAEAAVVEFQQRLDSMGTPVDVSKLAVIINVTREMGDVAARISTAEGEAQQAQDAVERQLISLRPQIKMKKPWLP